jgi:hypothetical protein
MAWKTEVHTSDGWNTNALVFATEKEAVDYGHELLSRWWVPDDSRAVESADAVNYKFENGRAVSLG